jgi:hypothetical protein
MVISEEELDGGMHDACCPAVLEPPERCTMGDESDVMDSPLFGSKQWCSDQ